MFLFESLSDYNLHSCKIIERFQRITIINKDNILRIVYDKYGYIKFITVNNKHRCENYNLFTNIDYFLKTHCEKLLIFNGFSIQ